MNLAPMYSGKKKEVNRPDGSKHFFPVERGKFFLAPWEIGGELPREGKHPLSLGFWI